MGHRCDYEGKLIVEENGDLTYIVTARYKDKSEEVYKVCEDGNQYCRYLWYVQSGGGYFVTFPGESYPHYYYGRRCIQEEEDWSICDRLGIFVSSWPTREEDLKNIAIVRPDLKYLLQKYKGKNGVELIDLVCMYESHLEIEALVDLGLNRIALNNSFMRYTPSKKRQIVNFIKENKDFMNEYTTLNQILTCLKNKIFYKDYERFMYAKKEIELFKYLVRKDISPNYYDDYRRMGIRAGHDMEDPYWKFPNDIVKAHNKVMEEIKNIERTNEKIKDLVLYEVTKNLVKNNVLIDGYDVFIPCEMKKIKKQCDVLYQCLIRGKYIEKMMNQEIVLVFIWKDGNPIATAEIDYNKKLLQFYGDERDRLNCKPSEEVESVLNKWLEKAIIIKRKFVYKKKFYKGFLKKEKGIFYGYKDYKFEVGKTYSTSYDDATILATGGAGVNATEKVFHFCSNIAEIKNHYSPKEDLYCEVEPLGPLLNLNGVYFSNKIKIVRQLTVEEINKLAVVTA